jgi:signal transduction histidine kinase
VVAQPLLLVVEDDVTLLDGLRDMLELADYQVVTARHGLEALACLEQHAPDLIVSDINMPRLNGYELLAQVRARPEWVHIPFIFLTAKGEKADVRRGKGLGVDDYITKPFDEADLLVAVQSKLQRQAQIDAVHGRRMAELKRTILTTLNHEFRTPLTYITGYAGMLGEQDLSSAELTQFMRGIQAGSGRLRQLVDDFILLVELQTGETELASEHRATRVVDVPGLLRSVLDRFEARAAERGVTLLLDWAPPLPAVRAEPDLLANAVGRLIDNGIKFSQPGRGQVHLAARAAEGRLLIDVRDDGMGMPPAELERIFDVFYQINRAKLEQQGSGSGLAIAQGIVRVHGGDLRVRSAPGEGSTFTIDLPALA